MALAEACREGFKKKKTYKSLFWKVYLALLNTVKSKGQIQKNRTLGSSWSLASIQSHCFYPSILRVYKPGFRRVLYFHLVLELMLATPRHRHCSDQSCRWATSLESAVKPEALCQGLCWVAASSVGHGLMLSTDCRKHCVKLSEWYWLQEELRGILTQIYPDHALTQFMSTALITGQRAVPIGRQSGHVHRTML